QGSGGGEDDWHVVPGAARHDGRVREFLDGADPQVRAHLAQHEVTVETRCQHHALDAFGGWHDDGKPVGTAEAVELLEGAGLVRRDEPAGCHGHRHGRPFPLSDTMMSGAMCDATFVMFSSPAP